MSSLNHSLINNEDIISEIESLRRDVDDIKDKDGCGCESCYICMQTLVMSASTASIILFIIFVIMYNKRNES